MTPHTTTSSSDVTKPSVDDLEVVIGLETHVQLNKLKTKMFCGCSTDYHEAPPNTHVCPVCLGLPGSMPVINRKAVMWALKMALALNCKVESTTHFYRKNYYYPDLPKGFQITQYDFPIGSGGYIEIEGDHGTKRIRIRRVHMEEDPGRLVHVGTIDKSYHTLIDYNRSGMALLEIVTEPDISSPKEARAFLFKLRSIVEYLEISDPDMEGAMRVDANVSLGWGVRTEIKNITSHRGVEKALSYEIIRQRGALRRGATLVQETRHFDEARNITISLRSKEGEADYRYFPEPDLPPFSVIDWIEEVRAGLPELPDEKRVRFIRDYGITEAHARALTSDAELANLFEALVSRGIEARICSAWVADVLEGELNYRNMRASEELTDSIYELLEMFMSGNLSDRAAVMTLRAMLDEGVNPKEYVQKEGLLKADEGELETVVNQVLEECEQAVDDYHAGKKEALNYLVGQVMKHTRGRADANASRELLREALDRLK
ncbi:MAG: Asp-tRNA(Asn)/Glu-tRNA(Gln) amidotransferase subunit GatB [Methermicoccaceae archaeon]